MGQTLPLARACAAAVKLQCALLLLLVLRNFISWYVQSMCGRRRPKADPRDVDETKLAFFGLLR